MTGRGRAALAGATFLAAALAAGCAREPRAASAPETPERVQRALEDARDPVERGGERAMPNSGQLLDERRTRRE